MYRENNFLGHLKQNSSQLTKHKVRNMCFGHWSVVRFRTIFKYFYLDIEFYTEILIRAYIFNTLEQVISQSQSIAL